GVPCDITGDPLPPGALPPPPSARNSDDWTPFTDRVQFETTNFFFRDAQLSQRKIDTILRLWAASLIHATGGDEAAAGPPLVNHKHMHSLIDSIPLGDAPWKSFTATYTGVSPEHDGGEELPSWMTARHEVWYRNPRTIVRDMLANPDFGKEFDAGPFRRYGPNGSRHYQNLMSGNWAWRQADLIAEDANCHGSMFVPIILGSDKTTVSVATGQNDYYPVYISIGNVHNNVQRSRRNAVALLAFLAIPKCEKQYRNDEKYRRFRRQLFHSSLATILKSLRPGMSTPEVTRCPNGHYRRVVYGIGPYIADYPEQVLVACVVQNWCPTCLDHRTNLGSEDPPQHFRSRVHTEALLKKFNSNQLWDDYGVPFTNDFPRADVYELIAGDLLHQLIKG
ncbi:hypothetical protein K474DRAFT_1722024, partial [Panus rudis PR-1116 ss-1]